MNGRTARLLRGMVTAMNAVNPNDKTPLTFSEAKRVWGQTSGPARKVLRPAIAALFIPKKV